MTIAAPFVCANHPDRPTTLRCNRCEKPICSKCARITPTGYRCPECISGQQKVFETAIPRDYFLAFPIAGIISLVGAVFAMYIGFFIFLVGPIAGTIIAESVRFVTQKRRSTRLFQITAAGVIAGCLPAVAYILFNMLIWSVSGELSQAAYWLPDLIWVIVFGSLAATTTYYRLKGINLKF